MGRSSGIIGKVRPPVDVGVTATSAYGREGRCTTGGLRGAIARLHSAALPAGAPENSARLRLLAASREDAALEALAGNTMQMYVMGLAEGGLDPGHPQYVGRNQRALL